MRDETGWRVEPSTDREEVALDYLLSALQEKYAKCVEAIGADLSSCLPLETHIPDTVASG